MCRTEASGEAVREGVSTMEGMRVVEMRSYRHPQGLGIGAERHASHHAEKHHGFDLKLDLHRPAYDH